MNGWTGESSTGYCGVAEVSWKRLIKQHLQLDSNSKVNSQNGNGEYVDNIQYKSQSGWKNDHDAGRKDFFFADKAIIDIITAFCKFIFMYVLRLWWCNWQETKHSPVSRTIAADFTSCRTKPSCLLICFLQFLPQAVTAPLSPPPPPKVDSCDHFNRMLWMQLNIALMQ